MDAEGAEKYILDNMTSTLDGNPNMRMITEYNPRCLEYAGVQKKEFLDGFSSRGYHVYKIDERRGVNVPADMAEL